jgi:hypothetical protein
MPLRKRKTKLWTIKTRDGNVQLHGPVRALDISAIVVVLHYERIEGRAYFVRGNR